MSIKIINSQFSNNGKGIVAKGKVDLEVTNSSFIGNGKDIELMVDEASNITIDSIVSMDCKTESITIQTYNNVIDDARKILESQKDVFTEEQINKLNDMLDKLTKAKGDSNKIKKVLVNIYEFTKSTSSGLLVAYLKMKFGW